MEIHYIRKMMTSHMVVEQMGELTEWEEQMIAHVAVEGILFGACVRENEKNSLWYDITGKQSLDMVLESGEAGYALLCRILTGIYEAVESIENILLQADGLLLVPECILLDYRTEQIYFCYYPGSTKRVTEAFAELMEYLLTRLDHGDERVVELAYGVYERASKGDGGLRELKQLLRMPYEQEESEQESGEEDFMEPETGAGEVKSEADIRGAEATPGIIAWLKTLPGFSGISDWKQFFQRKRLFGRGEARARRREPEEETFVFEPEEEAVQPVTRPTVLLAELARQPEGILRYEGKGTCEDLVITGTSYVIGSEPGCAGYIPSATVSRKHARITRTEDIYFVEDLNSSNGTYVGGELLNYKTKVSLQKNEIVIFADEKFRFI